MPDNVMKMEFIPVGGRLRPLRSFRDKELIKVVTGVRRCCKTTLMELFAEELKEGVEAPRMIGSSGSISRLVISVR